MENIEKLNTNACSQETEILDEIIFKYRQSLKQFKNQKEYVNDGDLALMICHSLCCGMNLNSAITSVCGLNHQHYVLVVEINERYFLLDPTYKQFFKAGKHHGNIYNHLEKFRGSPGFFLMKNKAGRIFAEEVFKNGYFECTEQNMKIYCDGFVLCKYNRGRIIKKLVYDNNLSGQEYLEGVVLRKLEENHIPQLVKK